MLRRRSSKKHICSLSLGSDSMLPVKEGGQRTCRHQCQKLTLIAVMHPETERNFVSYPAIVAERQRQFVEGGCWVIHPYSLLSLIWCSFMAVINCVFMIIAPLRFSYILPTDPAEYSTPDHLLLALQVVVFIDIITKFNTGYKCHKETNIVMVRSRIACCYLLSWFLVDLISILPLGYLIPWLQLDYKYQMFILLLPCVRCTRLPTALNDLKNLAKVLGLSYLVRRGLRHAILFMITMHWCSCFMYFAPIVQFYWTGSKPEGYCRFLVKQKGDLTLCSEWFRYEKAMFIACAAFFGTGYSMFSARTPAEITIYACVILYGSVFMVYTLAPNSSYKVYMSLWERTPPHCPAPHLTIAPARWLRLHTVRPKRYTLPYTVLLDTRSFQTDESNLNRPPVLYANLGHNKSTECPVADFMLLLKSYMTLFNSSMRYQELLNQVEKYMRHKQYPLQMKNRVRVFYNYRYQERYFKEEAALECLSEQLRNEITLDTCHKLIDKVSLFEGLPPSIVGTILGCLKPEVYMPNDLVVRAGDEGTCMYFIASGTVAVYSLKGAEVCHLEDGAHFGEVALLMKDRKRVATVVSIEITQVNRLDAPDFRDFLITYQELYERIETLASKRMHETVLIDEAYKHSSSF